MLVGRDPELAQIDAALELVAAGSGASLLVVGEGGVGKTRLCDEAARCAARRGFSAHWGRSWETGGAPAYWPWTELLESIERGRGQSLLGGHAASGAGEFSSGDPAQQRFALFQGVARFLREISTETPLLLVLEDAHTADVPSLELAHFVARGIRASRTLLLVSMREREPASPEVGDALGRLAREALPLALTRLGTDHVAALVQHVIGRSDPALAAELFRLTEGNPLFVHETLRWISTRPEGPTLSALGAVPIAEGVAAVVRERVERLSVGARAVLEAAATIGREVPAAVLEAVTRAPDLERTLQELEKTGLVVACDPRRWLFSHLLVREALYRGIGPDRRRALHLAAAHHFANRARAGDTNAIVARAHHALLALPLGDPTDAAQACIAAAESARSQLGYEQAVTWLERARDEITADERTHAEIMLALGWAYAEAGDAPRQLAAFQRAAELARSLEDSRMLARAALGYGAYYLFGEVSDQLVSLLREALAALPEGETGLAARLEARLAAALTPAEIPDEPLALARAAVQRAQSLGDPYTLIEVAVGAGAAFAGFAPARESAPLNAGLVQRARAVGDRVYELRGLSRLVTDSLELGDVVRADAALLEAEAVSRSLDVPRYRWRLPLLRSMRAMIEGRFDECHAAVEEARTIAAEIDDIGVARTLGMHELWVALLADDVPELVSCEANALCLIATMSGASAHQDAISSAIAAWSGELDRARAALARLVAIDLRFVRSLPLIATIGDAAVFAQSPIASPFLRRLLVPRAESNATFSLFALTCGPPCTSTLGALCALDGDRDEALEHFGAAVRRTLSMRAGAHEAWVRFGFGRALATLGDASRARAELARAGEVAERLAMSHLARRIQAALGHSAPPPAETAVLSFTLERQREHWIVSREGRSFTVKNLRGMAMLAKLVAHPGSELHVMQLAGGDDETIAWGDGGEMLDPTARAAYERRLRDLRDTLEEAERFSDPARALRARTEIEALETELARAVGLGGRSRRVASVAERARVTVQRRVREAIRKIAEQDAELGRHLEFAVRTGSYCSYEPARSRR